ILFLAFVFYTFPTNLIVDTLTHPLTILKQGSVIISRQGVNFKSSFHKKSSPSSRRAKLVVIFL
ncbi:hypothetical protein, partial [Staphylococcus aureus]|uniref:hypothetical protein n=1 Tax=Staphylococcus aureus TaxID=1280 RepID=UPI00210A4503